MTDFPTDEAIEALVRAFLDCDLPKERWTHEAHFAAALWMLRNRGLAAASREMPGLIRRYNESVGGVNSDTAGYHETITQASLMAADTVLAGRAGQPLHAVLTALLASSLGRSDWLFSNWSRERLMSVDARRGWVDPDLTPLEAVARAGVGD